MNGEPRRAPRPGRSTAVVGRRAPPLATFSTQAEPLRYVTAPGGLRIHVACAGPDGGLPVLLLHGFPQHWWWWRRLIGPPARDGHRVLVPDLRGAGWSDAPRGSYRKADMAEDLAAVLDRLDVGPVTIAAHDWAGLPG